MSSYKKLSFLCKYLLLTYLWIVIIEAMILHKRFNTKLVWTPGVALPGVGGGGEIVKGAKYQYINIFKKKTVDRFLFKEW